MHKKVITSRHEVIEWKIIHNGKMIQDIIKTLEATSTFSVGSRIFDDCDATATTGVRMNIGQIIEGILLEAQKESRLISGLNNASKYLKETDTPEQSLFFFIAPSLHKDSLTHMQEVVLQSFCFENDIYIIKLDNAAKLTKILGSNGEITCALVQKSSPTLNSTKKYSDLESSLIDHCEDFWGEPVQPIHQLPDK